MSATAQLVERDRELEALEGALTSIAEGDGHVVVVEGPAGMGKSALIAEARRSAPGHGFRVLSARGSELEVDFPFGVVRQLFEGALAEPGAREAAFAEAGAPAEGLFQAPSSPAEAPTGAVSFSILHGLYWMTLNLAGDQPTLLVVDDLHWCDRPSLRYLAYLVNRLEGMSIGIVAGLRDTDPGTDPSLIGDIAGNPSAVSIRPRPLSSAAVNEVVALRFDQPGDDVFGAACERATGGNPLLLQQLLGGLALEGATPTRRDAGAISDVGPRVIARSVLGRLGKLPPEATATARAVAILGDGADVATVAALSGQELTDVARITGALSQAEILRSGSPLGFAHPVVAEVVLQDIPAAERQLQHWQAAKLLEEADASSERVAAQLLAAPPIGEEWAIERLAEAALTATANGAADSAVTYLTRMLAEPLPDDRRPNVLLQLGMSEAGTGGPHAIEHLTQAYRTLDSPEARGYAAYALSRSLLFVGEPQRAADLAAEARRELPEAAADIARIVESAELISVYFGAKVPDAEERYERLREMPADPSGGEAVLAAAASYDWLYRGGTAEECADLASSAIERAARMEFDTGLTWIVANVVLVAADRPEAMEMWDRALARSHKQGGMFGVMTVHLWRGFTQLRHGELLEAEESLLAGIEQINLLGGATLDYAHGLLATTLIEQGRVDEAERTLYEIDRPEGIGDGALLWRVAEIELLLAKARAEEALAAAETHAELCGWRINPAFATSLSLKARALDKLGRREEAEEVLELELERAERWGAPGTVGRTLRLLGEIREERGLADLERAIELLGRSPMKLELGRALAALGAAQRRGRKQSEAREPLRRAYELAEACGADPLAAQARTELHASGARPRSSALSGPASLTASERRVTDLALEGQTNKQIAQALYVTPKTVEVHLSNAYRKLEISSRRELSSVLTPEG